MVPADEGILPSQPGNPAERTVCENPETWTEALLRPVSSAERVGAQIAVVWKFVYRKPLLARLSNVGVWMSPPNVAAAPKPTSSRRIHTTFGAPTGAFTGSGHHSFDSARVLPTTPLYGCVSWACSESFALVANSNIDVK